jgi:hypothetical protein
MIARHLFRLAPSLLGVASIFAVFIFGQPARADDNPNPNLFTDGSFDVCTESYNPWSGVDGDGNIHGLPGTQNAVGDDGNLYGAPFSPSAAFGDLNGDGKPDLVMADTRGFIWYFPNTGTVQQPKFTQGEVTPVWLGEKKLDDLSEGTDNIVPRIQLVDYDGSGKLSLVVGTYAGKLFYVPNIGSTAQPDFPVVEDTDRYLVSTHAHGTLWCNYLAPFLYSWFSLGHLDLIMGEGTYSANSIYLFQNKDANDRPNFNEDFEQKIIPGMGREQLTPTVVDWNNDGKPDVLAGERTGYLNLFLNTSKDPLNPTFDLGQHITVGGNDKLGGFTTVTTTDLTGNKLPNLVIGTDAGTLLYATNSGKLGTPNFSAAATPLKGVNPFPKIMVPTNWTRLQPAGVPDELVVCTNPTLEPGFKFPEGEKTIKYALRFMLYPITNVFFKKRYYPEDETYFHEHVIASTNGAQPMSPHTRYTIHFWAKADETIQGTYIRFGGVYQITSGDHRWFTTNVEFNAGTEWTEIEQDFRFDLEDAAKDATINYGVQFRFRGQGNLYLDDMTIKVAQ